MFRVVVQDPELGNAEGRRRRMPKVWAPGGDPAQHGTHVRGRSESADWRAGARAGLDAALAGAALVLLLPLLALIAVAIRLTGRGPVLFRQERLGRGGWPFTFLKFRTMTAGAPDGPHRRYLERLADEDDPAGREGLCKLAADPRVTRVGRLLRRTSLDELPQLLNVVRGEMALVGPRPALAYELRYYRPEHFERFRVRPGLTGLWQVSGRAHLDFQQMLDLDVDYVRRRSLGLDLRILRSTPAAMIGGTA